MTIWRPGMKAVCIKRGQWRCMWGSPDSEEAPYNGPAPKYGEVCIIESVADYGKMLVLQGYLGYFCATQFRPVQNRKTDISVFREILRKHTIREDA